MVTYKIFKSQYYADLFGLTHTSLRTATVYIPMIEPCPLHPVRMHVVVTALPYMLNHFNQPPSAGLAVDGCRSALLGLLLGCESPIPGVYGLGKTLLEVDKLTA